MSTNYLKRQKTVEMTARQWSCQIVLVWTVECRSGVAIIGIFQSKDCQRCHCLFPEVVPLNLCLVNGVDEIGFDRSYCKEYIASGFIQERFTNYRDPGDRRSAFRLTDQPCDGDVRELERLRLCFAVFWGCGFTAVS